MNTNTVGVASTHPGGTHSSVIGGRGLGVLLAIAGCVGFVAAFVLAVEKFMLLRDPFYTPSCTTNATFSCGSVMNSPASEVLGFPNPLLGIAGFAVVVTSGAAVLAGTRLAAWYWVGLQLGATAGLVLVHWLIWQSLYVIGALCPYCMVVWAVTITIFWYVSLRNVYALRRRLPQRVRAVAEVALRYHSSILAAWLLVLAGLTGGQVWSR